MDTIVKLRNDFRNHQKKLIPFYQKLFADIKKNSKYNFYVMLFEKEVLNQIKDPNYYKNFNNKKLFGIPYFLKDNFMVKNVTTSAGSKILLNFVPNFSSTVYQLLKNEGAILLGKSTMDELAMGGTGLTAKEGPVINCLDPERITGGSSSGSAVSVALKHACFTIGSDTGDSVRKPASYLGIKGFKPSFGLISRYGLVPFSPALDTVGFFAHSVEDLEILIDILAKPDSKDFANQKKTLSKSKENLNFQKQKILILNLDESLIHPKNIALFKNNVLQPLTIANIKFEYHQIPKYIVDSLKFLYQIISYSEALSSQANLTGINFGHNVFDLTKIKNFFELIKENRTKGFGKEVKRRYVLGAYYSKGENQQTLLLKAMKIRTFLTNYFNDLFQKHDFMIHPATRYIAPRVIDVINQKIKINFDSSISDFLLFANFLGLPSLTIPIALERELPLGINIFSNFNSDYQLLNFAKQLEKIINFKK